MLKDIFSKKNRALLSELVRTDFKLRYQGSVLGYTWSLLRPLFMFLILYIVFAEFLDIGDDIPNFPIYLLLGIVLWQFFSDTTSQGLGSIVARGDLIRKIRIPRWMIVLSSSVSAFINLCLNLVVVAIFIAFNPVDISVNAIWFPVLIIELYFFSFGLSLFLSAAYVKYRDVSYIWDVVLQAGFYVTPILYPMTKITSIALQKLIILNPVAQVIQDARSIIVTKETLTITEIFQSQVARLIPLCISVIVLIIGIWYFRRESTEFAENL